uniref:Uncharacterized protein n=1 Tax=Anopheles christyi TaxID=43041 RepID=A0A182KDH2_9DIPT
MGRREAWSAANRSTDSRTKPTHWEYRGRRDIGKGTLAATGDDGGDDRDGEPDHHGDDTGNDGNERKRANDGGKLEKHTVKIRSDMKSKSTKDDTHMHRSRTNLLNADRDMYVEDVDEHDPEYQSLKRIHHHHHHHHGAGGNGGKPVTDDALPIDDDSMRRHEMDRGSDLNYERRGSFKRQGHAAAPQLVTHGDDIEPRDQYFIKDGNAEILRLITRGRNEEENIYVNIPQQQQQQQRAAAGAANQPQYIMVDNGGKEILMRRYIEEQANGKQIIREHYQLLPGTTFIQTIPNEVPVRRGEHVTEVKIGAAQAGGRSKEQVDGDVEGGRLKPAVSTHSLMHQELEHSLKQQNALLRQILLEKEKLEERYNQYEQALETQSLPCQSMAVVVAATQTDCDTGTQTDPVRGGVGAGGRRRTKSENDDSLSEDEYEYVRYSPPDSPDGVYLIKRRRHRKKTKHRGGGKGGLVGGEYSGGESTGERKSNRRIIVVESVKRKIRTPIQEEEDELLHHGREMRRDQHGQGSHRRGGQETRTSILRRKRNEELSRGSSNGNGSNGTGKDHRLKRDVLMEISDSLHGEQGGRGGGAGGGGARRNNGAAGGGESRRKKVYRKNVKYYEDSDGSEKEVVVQKNYFSADSLDEITSDVEDYRYSVTKTSKSVTVSPKTSVEQRISRRDDKTETTTTRIRLTTSESPSRRQSTGPAQPPPAPKGPAPKPPRMSKSLSKEEGLNEPPGEQHAVNPKYMDWYYNLGKESDSLEKRDGRKRPEAIGTTMLTTTTTSSTTTITTGGSRKKGQDGEGPQPPAPGTKSKPEPAPRTSPPKEARLLKEDIQHARKVAQSQQQQQHQQGAGSEAGNSHPLLQHSEHRYEAEYGTGPPVKPAPPDKLPHYLYPETPPIVSRDNKVQIKIVDQSSSAAAAPAAPATGAKSNAIGGGSTSTKNAKTLNVSTLEDDHDSGIAMNSLLHTKGKRNKIADKKSIFTIAYDDVRIRQIRSESDTPPFS